MTQNRVVSTLGDSSIAGRNFVANGDFRLWSRGTSFTLGTPGQLGGPDGVFVIGNNSAFTLSRQTFTPGTAPVTGYEGAYFMRLTSTTGNVDPRLYITIPGDVRSLAGKTITVSFWAKCDITTPFPSGRGIRWEQSAGTGGSGGSNGAYYTPTLTSSWVRYSYTETVPSLSGVTIGTDSALQFGIKLAQSTAFNFDLWGFQVELGSVATAFNVAGGNNQLDTVIQGAPGYDGVLVSTNPYWSAGSSSIPSTGWAGYVVAGKNAVINGGFDIWQRGTSISLAASSGVTYISDRWCLTSGTGQALTISRQTTSDTTNLPNIQYCMRYQRNSGQTGTSILYLSSSLETINSIPLAGKTVTLSFYARAGANYSAVSNALTAYILTGTGTDQNRMSGAYTGDNTSIVSSWSLTTTWQRFTLTGTLPATTTEIAPLYCWTPSGTAGTNDYFEVTGVQLEVGSVATPFSRAGGTYQGELAACQRYYFRTYPGTSTPFGLAYAVTTTLSAAWTSFPVQMRTTPTALEQTGTPSDYAVRLANTPVACTAIPVFDVASTTGALTDFTVGSGQTAGQAGFTRAASGTVYLGWSAEL